MNNYVSTGFESSFERLAKALAELAVVVSEVIHELFEDCIFIYDAMQDYWKAEADRKRRRALYKIDFTRPVIQHQVSHRKPKHLIKKVIR